MKYEINQLVIGKVTNVKPYALFMSFEDGVEGLLHISEISNNYIRDIEKFGSVGDEIKVKVLSVDKNNGFLRVSLKQVPNEEAYSTHKNIQRNIPLVSENSFDILRENLPKWMEDTLKEIKENK
ncbi:MAG: S1 RNA-binding domain-containing protein [Bacilli bacterium]|nr:S1 RNA-binding domain-containing protein [Bacilli bacterium]